MKIEWPAVPYDEIDKKIVHLVRTLKRRHLTSSQRAALAVDILPALEAEARKRQVDLAGTRPIVEPAWAGEARTQAARAMQTNRQYVSDAKKLKEEAPQIFEQVKAGEMLAEMKENSDSKE
ncbi:MAG: hypothetical protein M1140_07505 [Chloroflexi bacterium]|nr:hypothetical protein [Chloroflexota bacterium]